MKRYLMHSSKGSTWSKKNHKYIAIKNGRYIYPNEVSKTGYVARSMTSTPANLGTRSSTNGVVVGRTSATPANLNNKSKITSYYSQMAGGRTTAAAPDRRVGSNSVSSATATSTSSSSGSGKSAKDYLSDSVANSKEGKKEEEKKKKAAATKSASSSSSGDKAVTTTKASIQTRNAYNPGIKRGQVSYRPNRAQPLVARNFSRNTAGARASRGSTQNRGYSIKQLRGLSPEDNSSKSEVLSGLSRNDLFVNNGSDQNKIKNGVNEAKGISEKVSSEVTKQTSADRARMKKESRKKNGRAKADSNAKKKMRDLDWTKIGKSKTLVNNLLKSR